MGGPEHITEASPFNLERLLRVVVARWHVAAAIVVACFLIGVIKLHLTPTVYSVEMQVVATSDQGTAQSTLRTGAALLSQLGGRGDTTQDRFELYLAGLQNIETARALSLNSMLMHHIFASEWSERDKSWQRPESIRGWFSRTIRRALGIYVQPWQPPDATSLLEFLQGNIGISRSMISPVVTVSIQTGDRAFGVDLLSAAHNAVDGVLRQRTLERATQYVNYLNALMSKSTVVEYRAAMADTIMQQEKIRMAAASGAPFAADVFARPTPPRFPSSPNAVMILLASIFVGVIIALAEAIMRDRLGIYRRFLNRATGGDRREGLMPRERPPAA